MRRFVDVRALIFYAMALMSVVLLIPCPDEFHHVGITLSLAYVVLGTFSWLDAIVRSGSRRKR